MNATYGFAEKSKRVSATPRGAYARDISILGLIEWACQRECASLDFDEMQSTAGERPSVSSLWVLMQRHNLGCQVDGGGKSDPHPDADIVASALAALPDARGGRGMALTIKELAVTGQRPNWLPNAKTKCEPVNMHKGRHGTYAKSEVCATLELQYRGRKRTVEVRWCPVRFTYTPDRIAAARRNYLRWWDALHDLRINLQHRGLTAWRVTDEMPPRTPWVKR